MNQEHGDKFRVTVHFVAAGEPFKDDNADRNETVGHLKQRVLTYFDLTEGQTPDGNITTYTLYHQKTPLENMNQTLGDVAGEHNVLQLKLSQQIIQG
jgi:hypothetical protein